MKTLKCITGDGKSSFLLYRVLIISAILISLFSVSCKEAVYYSVKFESNGGTTVESQTVPEGQYVTEPIIPTQNGCVFTGWYSDRDLTIEYDFSTPVKNNFVLYAKWSTSANTTDATDTTHTVYFDSCGGSDVESQEVEDGQCAIEPKPPKREGYIFCGWYWRTGVLYQKTPYNFSTHVACDIVLYAEWIKYSGVLYNVTYNPGDGTGEPVTVKVYPGKNILKFNTPEGTLPEESEDDCTNFTKDNHSFLQWDINGVKVFDGTEIEVNNDIVATATWLPSSSIGSFDSSGNFTVDGSSEVIIPRLITNEGNKLVESVIAGSFTGSVLVLPPSVSAIPDNAFKNCTNLKSVYFNTEKPPVVGDDAFPPGTTFYITGTASKSEYAEALGVSADKIETVDYFTEYFTVSFKGIAAPSQVVLKGSTAARPADSKLRGYKFKGWYSDSALTSPYNFSTPVTTDLTIYAKWTRDTPASSANCITFSSTDSFTVSVATPGWDGKIQYSTDGKTWLPNSGSWDGSPVSSSSDNKLYFRGMGNNRITSIYGLPSDFHAWSIKPLNTNTISLSGDIMTLLDYEDPDIASMEMFCFMFMFRDCKALESVSSNFLSATELTYDCYASMFEGCTKLTTAPELPATDLATECYTSMFKDCTSLTSAPALPATGLADFCYYEMFRGCSSLKVEEGNDAPVSTKIFTSPSTRNLKSPLKDMFTGTGGTFTGSPTSRNTYHWYV